MWRDAVKEVYTVALQYGIEPDKFYSMSLRDSVDYIGGLMKREQRYMQQAALTAYRQADYLALRVSQVFGGKAQGKNVYEAFPGFWPEEASRPQVQDWRITKERVAAFATAYSDKMKKKGGDPGGADD